MVSATTVDSDVEEVHRSFRGCAELAKRIIAVGLLFDLFAACLAVHGLVTSPLGLELWRPLVALGCLVAAVGLRGVAEYYQRFAQRCRRVSVHSYAMGEGISPVVAADLRGDSPPFATLFAKDLPAQTLGEYYEPQWPAGEGRLREIVAHSAFYTWRLLRASAALYGLCGLIVVAGTATMTYKLAAGVGSPPVNREVLLDTLFTVVLGSLAVRAFAASANSWASASHSRKIADRAIRPTLPIGRVLHELVSDYDIDRNSGPTPLTIVYKMSRNALARDWYQRRRALVVRGSLH